MFNLIAEMKAEILRLQELQHDIQYDIDVLVSSRETNDSLINYLQSCIFQLGSLK